jgi:tetratricopeptide (TPR) repeat protein
VSFLHCSIAIEVALPLGIVRLHLAGNHHASLRARAGALPCSTGRIDRITIDGGFEALNRSEAVALLRECRRVLRTGGQLRLSALDVDAISAQPVDPSGVAGLARRLRACRWIGSPQEWNDLASQVGLVPRPAAPGSGRDEDGGWATNLEFTKPLPPSSTDRPLVSVLIPAYRSRFFAEALDSVLAQTYDNIEIVICDDCPTDEIETLVAPYAVRDARIRYVRNQPTLGSRQCHIRCLSLASGDAIKFLSDDDRLHPACVERMVACLTTFPDVTLVTAHRQCMDAAGRPLADLDGSVRPVSEDSRVDGAALARAMLMHGGLNIVGGPTAVMFRRADLVDTRPDMFSFAGRPYRSMGDMVMWFNLLSRGDAIYLVETLSDVRLHPDQEMRAEWVRADAAQNVARMQVDGARMGLIPEDAPTGIPWIQLSWRPQSLAAAVGDAQQGRTEMQSGNLDAALQHLQRAAAAAPDLPFVHGDLASVLLRMGRHDEARAAAERTLTLNPTDRIALAIVAELRDARRHSGIQGAAADPELEGAIDHWPAADQLIGGLVAIEGWVVSHPPVATDVRVLVDGCEWPAWTRRQTGLNTAPPAVWVAPPDARPRFRLMIDTRNIPDGRHVLTITALGGEGRALTLGRRPVVIRNREILSVADGPAAEVVEHLVREREDQRLEMERRLEIALRERDEAMVRVDPRP